MRLSYFAGTKLRPSQLAMVIKRYTSLDKIAAPTVDELADECEGGRQQVRNIVDKLRAMECAIAKKENSRGTVTGDIEIDEHGIRSFHVSKTNPAFLDYHTKELYAKKHPYFLNYIRIIGLRQRGGGKLKAIVPVTSSPSRWSIVRSSACPECGTLSELRCKGHHALPVCMPSLVFKAHQATADSFTSTWTL